MGHHRIRVRGKAGGGTYSRGHRITTWSFHTSQVNCGNFPKQCHVSTSSYTVCTGPIHTVPPLLPPSSDTCVFSFFPPLIPVDVSPPLQVQRTPSHWQSARGDCPPPFHGTGASFFFFFFSIADHPFSPTCTQPPCLFVLHRLHYVALVMLPSPHVALATSHLTRCIALTASRLTHRTCHVLLHPTSVTCHAVDMSPSPCHLSRRPLHARPLSPDVSPSPHITYPSHVALHHAFITRPPCQVTPHLVMLCAGSVGEMEGN